VQGYQARERRLVAPVAVRHGREQSLVVDSHHAHCIHTYQMNVASLPFHGIE
jgi:hypothetical protein